MQLITACPLCGGTDPRERFRARDPHYGIPGEYSIVRCAGCSLQFANPMYSDEELASLYPPDYYSFRETTKPASCKTRLKRTLGYWQGTKEPHFEKPGIFLDIGCGSGEFVAHMRQLGWDSHGVEMNDGAATAGSSRGIRIVSGTIQDAKFPSEHFDYVRASHSFEHMTRPHQTLNEIRRILKPSGTLLIAVPNIESLTASVFKQYWWHLCPPVHPFGYSVRTLTRLLEQHGFRVIKVRFNSDYVGLVGSLQIWLNRGTQRKSCDGMVFRNRPLRVLGGWLLKLCDATNRGDMIEVIARRADRARTSEPAQQSDSTFERAIA